MASIDGKELLECLGEGETPEALGLRRTPEGLVDLRGLRLGKARPRAKFRVLGATFDYVPGKPIFEKLSLSHVDLSGAQIEQSLWVACTLHHVRFEHVRGAGVNFASSGMESVSFARADLRRANWGEDRLDGPLVADTEFIDCDLRGSMYAHPLFRNCRWVNCNLEDVNFGGARFEDCTFVGLLNDVMFHGRYRDPDPRIADLRNSMRNVDFSRALLKDVSFDDSIDLMTCIFPQDGYLRIPRPKAAYDRAIRRVRDTWFGKAKDRALFYLEETAKFVPEDQPLDVVRPMDFVEGSFGRDLGEDVARKLIRILEDASRE
ncbi:MAG: hypothetical protein A3K66_01775 [Euryarchaeota archaeon RBG_16_67_27]|nr:MAG: hypothetical protein A3K66_01775 [Euryarchaeota archaeon RBG_16_67_27]HLB68371.1 pentapeptide repeat-containing protein [Thermoplasmata archaeon]